MINIDNIKKFDPVLLICIFLLCIVGGVSVFTTTYFPNLQPSTFFYNQLLFYIVGFILFIFIATVDYKKLNNKIIIIPIILITFLSLILVLVIGDESFGAQRWINIGSFTLQPSELTKISIILITSYFFTIREKRNLEKIFNIYEVKKSDYKANLIQFLRSETFLKFMGSIVILITFIILILLQKSLGNSILSFLIYSIILFYSIDIKVKYLVYLLVAIVGLNLSFGVINFNNLYSILNINLPFDLILVVISFIVILVLIKYLRINFIVSVLIFILMLPISSVLNFTYNNLIDQYQRKRIETFLNPSPELELTDDYNRKQSLTAVGSGQVFGRGLLNGNMIKTQLLPFAFTDFAFAAHAEQFGMIGSIFLFLIYIILLYRIYLVAENSNHKFGKLIAIGVGAMIFLNTIQHIGMNLGLLPITGVPLPLISYGGSAVLTIFIGLGLVQAIQIKNVEEEEKIVDFRDDFGFNKRKFHSSKLIIKGLY
jgi:rod shape determining protein RodA